MNSLWFLSLILSLASALFGILGKQWCREYMKWYSVLSRPQENIILRQVRYEAWEEWRVVSLIAAIPALLESALVLFFIGLVVYSWTLEVTVFAFVAAAVRLLTLSGEMSHTTLTKTWPPWPPAITKAPRMAPL